MSSDDSPARKSADIPETPDLPDNRPTSTSTPDELKKDPERTLPNLDPSPNEQAGRLDDGGRGTTEAGGVRNPPTRAGKEGSRDMAKPSANIAIDESRKILAKEVDSLDEGLIEGWKEDIDTLLIFAGLFSAVVTGFTIESYQWLKEAPEDITVALLRQISQQLNNSTVTAHDEFSVSTSDVRINVLWFLSLTIALVDALFGLLCKQWLREHRRQTHTRTPGEALALSWVRTQSLYKWHVHTILAFLPILLELAVFLFLAGVMILLWDRNHVVFAITTGVTAIAGLFYLVTSIIPTVDIFRQALQVSPSLREMRTRTGEFRYHSPLDFIVTMPPMEFVCPYKSPQAWAVFQVLKVIPRIPGFVRVLFLFLRRQYINAHREGEDMAPIHYKSSQWALNETLNSLSSWSSVDLEVIQRSDIELAPPFHELHTYGWLVAELRDSPVMLPHLLNVLKTLPIHLVMPAVLGQWSFPPDREWTADDIEKVLLSKSVPSRCEPHFSVAPEGEIAFFNRLLHCIHAMNHAKDPDWRDRIIRSQRVLDQLLNDGNNYSEFHRIGLPTIDKIARTLSIDPGIFNGIWSLFSESLEVRDGGIDHWVALMADLASYITASAPNYTLHGPMTTTSSFVQSDTGAKFLSKMHATILQKKVWEYTWHEDDMKWLESMDIVRRIHGLDVFDPIPAYFPVSPLKLESELRDLSTMDSQIDFDYLDSFSKHWGKVGPWKKEDLVRILSNHVTNYPQSNASSSDTLSDSSRISPLVMSNPGLKLIAFINNQLADDWWMYGYLDEENRRTWDEAIERVRHDRPDLPPEYFRPILHEVSAYDVPEMDSGRPNNVLESAEVVEGGRSNRMWPFRLWTICRGCGGCGICDDCAESRC